MKSYWPIAYGLLVLALLGYIIVCGWRNRALKRQQDALVQNLHGKRYWRVNLARPSHAQKFLKVLAFEAKGLLVLEDEYLRLLGGWSSNGAPFDWKIPIKDSQVEWIGNTQMRSGNLYWARITTPDGPVNFCADTGVYALPSREALSDIFRSVFPDYPLDANATKDFSLEKNPRSLAVIGLLFVLMAFALLDTYVISNYELVESQMFSWMASLWVRLGAMAALLVLATLCFRFLAGGKVPARESYVLSLMLGLMACGAFLPALKRVDQVLAQGPSQDYVYVVQRLGYLEPADPTLGLPNMRFKRANEYWSKFPAGTEYRIPFLKGPMGLWQMDHAKFDPPIYKFYTEGEGKK